MKPKKLTRSPSSAISSPENYKSTKGVQTLLGNPKKAIIKLSLPMILAMSIHTLYNFVDGLWVSGLGPDALSAVGFFFPFFFIMLAIATGIGMGGGSAISRKIGAKDKKSVDEIASHTMVIVLISSVVMTIPFLIFTSKIFKSIGAGPVAPLASGYAKILFGGTLIFLFTNVAAALLRAEGDVNRAMVVMMLGAGLNIILDPVFIYLLKFGVKGAAWATLISITLSSLFLFNWLFIKKNTYFSISFNGFRFRKRIIKDIMQVGIPSSFMQLTMAFSIFIINFFAVKAGGTDGVAIYTTGWRVVMFAALPLIGIAMAVTSVTGAAFGNRDYKKLDEAYLFSIKIGFMISCLVGIITFLLAPQIAWIFTIAEEGSRIRGDLITFFKIMCVFYPGISFGMLSSAMFQGTGKGTTSLILAVIRTIIVTTSMAFIFSVLLKMGLKGVWWGITTGNLTGALIAFYWGRSYIRKLNLQSH